MDPGDDPILPDRLKDDLSSLYRGQVLVPSEVDRVATSGARAHFARRGRWIRWVAIGSPVAAALVLAVVLVQRGDRHQVAHTATTVSAPVGDTNADGRVDIRDALSLARRIEAGSVQPTRREDVNRDEVIDRKDVDAIAMMAVRLDPEVVR